MATDPVCGMAVETGDAPSFDHDAKRWWFCSTYCRTEFAARPDQFLPPSDARETEVRIPQADVL